MGFVEVTIYALVFIGLSGVMAMVDAALLSVSSAEVEELVNQKAWGSSALKAVTQRITRAVVIVVIITNLINVLGPILVGQRAVANFGSNVIGVITAILTFGTILFSEIIPKSIGTKKAPLISRIAAPIVLALIYALYPLVVALDWLSRLFASGERPVGTEGQIRSLVTIGRRAGHIETDEHRLIHRAFTLNDKTAADVMTPLKDIISIPANATIRQAADYVRKHGYTRYPVFGNSIHELKGIILSKRILQALMDDKDDEPIAPLVTEGLVVDGKHRTDELIVLFRERRIHLAVVQVDGKTSGVVSLEDIVEELFGEIIDETDYREMVGAVS